MNAEIAFFKGSKIAETGLEEDEKQFLEFLVGLIYKTKEECPKALFILPDSQALLKPYYWNGMGRISSLEAIEAVGTCWDLTCSVTKSLKAFDASGGHREKLRLCAMFYPEKITLTKFLQQCQRLIKENISFSVGTPGDPESLEAIRQLRSRLSMEIHVFIESLEGFGIIYSQEEELSFRSIDPYFKVKGSKNFEQRFKEQGMKMNEEPCEIFGKFPLFRIPKRIRAFFIPGDEIPVSEFEQEDSNYLIKLKELKESAPLYLITSQPYKEAARNFTFLFPLLSGGIFAGGSHILSIKKGRLPRREQYVSMDPDLLTFLKEKQAEYGCQIRILEHEDMIYRLTMEKPFSRVWRDAEQEAFAAEIPKESFRCYVEQNCFHIVSANADTERGIALIRQWFTISSEDYDILSDL